MSNSTDPNNQHSFSFVFKTKGQLSIIEAQKRANSVNNIRKKWVAAAIIALASGTTVFLTQNNSVSAATNEPNTDVQVATQTTSQTQQANADSSQAAENKENVQPPANQADSSQAAENKENVQPPANQADHVKANVQSAWDQGYKGQGTVVAVIDSGADPSHKDFQTMPESPKLSKDDMEKKISDQGYGKYVNEKFPYVYNYADRDNDYITSDDSNSNDSPHGQHVSGIIAADGKPDGDKTYVVGVAPEAQLMQLRVFGQFSDEKTDDVAKAIYDATNLGADVIQMSLGQGVADQQLTNIEQKAVQYAIDHGVFVSISASNNGHSASVDDPNNIAKDNLDYYSSGGAQGNYEPLNSGTVANPGISKNALTVAAEKSTTGNSSDMADFSSWGPSQDYTLKPDLAAPGYQVTSTVNHDQYQKMSGTSMAGPFAAGSAALVLQRLKKTNPELKGAALVQAAKALLTNSTKPQTQKGYSTPVSPRRQGAGQIDVGAATSAPVYVTTSDGTSSVSLHQVSENTPFTLTFHNLTDQDQTYSFDDFGGGFTEQRDENTGKFHDVQLAGARVNGQNTFTLKAKETKELAYSLDLTGLTKNQLVEGFLKFTNSKDQSTVSVPYLAYYGDLTSENVFDQNANEDKPDIAGNRLVDEQNYPRGVADQESLKKLVNVDGDYNWQEVAKLYESGKVAFSPNNDQKSDLLKPYTYLKQNVKDLKVEILDANGKVVRVVADVQGVDKSYDENGVTKDTSLSVSMRDNPDAFEWDGKVYNSKTGQMETAKDGNYTYRMVATLWNEGPNQVQKADFPVIVDTTAPTLSNLSYDDTNHTLSGDYQDTGAGFTDYSYATVKINDKVFGFKLNEGNSKFSNSEKTAGHFDFALGQYAQAALNSADNKVSVVLTDVADNSSVQSLDVKDPSKNQGVSVWNATNGLAFDQTSPAYNKENYTFTLVGGASSDFYANGKLVQVHNGQYELPVSLSTTKVVFSSDPEQKNVLKTFTTTTPKAFFQWQKVDTHTINGNFNVTIPFVVGDNQNDIVVQAAVPYGDNVKAYAQDYFNPDVVYEGEVKDGVATFHVHTSLSGPNGVLRALLTGWAEVSGPSYNDKQVTSKSGVSSVNHIAVYYLADSGQRKVYTNRDDLQTDVQDENADPKDFGPGYYPGHASSDLTTRTDPNPDIHFDYMNDNDTTQFGQNAVAKGYYDPNSKLFTVSGQVDGNVESLTVLGDSSNEAASENQVSLANDGKFVFKVHADPTGQRPIAYFYKTKDGQTVRGTLNLQLDTVPPTLTVNQVNGDDLEVWTNNPKFVLSGSVNDNLDGYRLYVNGNNIYREFLNSGYNQLAGLNTDTEYTNPYGAHEFSQEENLDDDQGQATTHVFTVYVVDQVGNRVEKKLTVHYDPYYLPSTDIDNNSSSSDASNEKANDTTPVLEAQSFDLKHNAYVYDAQGQVLLDSNGNKQVLKKGDHISALENGKVFVVNGFNFYKIGDNSFVKTANTVLQPAKRLRLVQDAYVYDQNGKLVKRNGKAVVLKKGSWVNAFNNADVFVIKGQKHYKLADGQFVKVAATKTQKSKLSTLKHNSFVYDSRGKRVKKSRVLKKGTKVHLNNNGQKFVINHKTYYQVGKHYIKAANVR